MDHDKASMAFKSSNIDDASFSRGMVDEGHIPFGLVKGEIVPVFNESKFMMFSSKIDKLIEASHVSFNADESSVAGAEEMKQQRTVPSASKF